VATTSTAKAKRRRTPTTALGGPAGPRRVAIYLRRSTDDEHQPFSITAQETALNAYVTSQPGWTLAATYSDDASGATTTRPDLQRALTAARAGRYDVLLVYRVDRFSRRLSDLLALLGELDAAGVAFASATEPFDTSTSIGRMLVQLLGVFAEFERETIIDRVTSGMAAKAAKGKWVGGTRPYGYAVDKDTSKLVPNPAEAPHLAEIFALYTRDRLGSRAIAAELNRRGVPNRTGKPWSGHTIVRIIANPAYAGDITYGDVHVTGAHPALISRDTWQRASDIATARADAQNQRALSPSDYCLTGLITCTCGHKYLGTAATGRNRTYRYYTCFSRHRYGTAGCQAPRIPADAADTATLTALADLYTRTPALITDALARAQDQHASSHAGRHAEADALTAQITSKQAALDRYYTAFENGTLDEGTTAERVTRLREQVTQLQARHAEISDQIAAPPEPPPPGLITAISGYLAHLVTDGTTAQRKAAIETLIHEIRITEQGAIPVFKIPSPDTLTASPDSDGNPVRPMVQPVGRVGLEPTTGGL
jgi:site-specific DNA recombinase